ncbi:MAG: spermidine synthase [Pelagibacterales bacterium]|nr:spermidine synthase [Pelagibacterales bacterium]|tara:strand:+ start:455 stop:1297 length:843 start_codon:yes stop_codon:yes gene_type:complete
MKKFTEELYKKYNQNITIEKIITSQKSKFQNILIFDSKYFGRILTLDKVIQITEFDHFYYSEMLSHIPIITHGKVKRVLIIGGGDGAIAHEVLKHNSIKEVFICEIDQDVINLSIKYLKKINFGSLKNPKVKIIIEDASQFIKRNNFKNYFDLIIADRPDPIGPGKNLFKIKFYKDIKNALSNSGIAVFQNGVPFFQKKELKDTMKHLKSTFNYSGVYLTVVPTYIGGYMALTWSSNAIDISKKVNLDKHSKVINKLNTQYYTKEIHYTSFILPKWIKEI